MVKVVPHAHNVGIHDRCRTTVEPMVKPQWFVKMDEMAKPAIEALKSGELKFVPESFGKTYLHWLEGIRDWCISRQLWWGHRIPAYYCSDCGEMVVAKEMPKTCPKCGGTHLRQDEDTLDTWFSSALWALLNPWLAQGYAGASVFLSDGRFGDRIRYYFLLGDPYGIFRHRADGKMPLPHGADPRSGPRLPGTQDEQVPWKRHRSAGG